MRLFWPLLAVSVTFATCQNTSFTIDYDKPTFLLDGEPFRYISGSIHYFRIHPTSWTDRLKKVRALGFNAIQTYIPWNFHEHKEGQFDFSEGKNFTKFIEIAKQEGLYTLLRIGPYMCAEWDNGGLPWWLLKKKPMKLRSSDPIYIESVKKYFDHLLPVIKPQLRKNGGPILMLQIENEYGSYDACDHKYMEWLRDYVWEQLGNDVVLYTTDGPSEGYLKCGAVEGVLPTIDFPPSEKKDIIRAIGDLRKYTKGPIVNSEFYPGWLVVWGQKTQDLATSAEIVETAEFLYQLNASFNFYVIHGGTNFGFWNGAEVNAPCITSYDFTAPISEAGDITEKYLAIRDWVTTLKDWKFRPVAIPEDTKKKSYGEILLKRVGLVADQVESAKCVVSDTVKSFEQLNHPYGFVVYTTFLEKCGQVLNVPYFKDFAYVYFNGKLQGTLINHYNNVSNKSIALPNCKVGDRLDLVLENQGRQTYESILDYKGLLSDVYIDDKLIRNWTQCPLQIPWKEIKTSSLSSFSAGQSGLFTGVLTIEEVADTFIDTTGWGRGFVIVNKKNIGRYWPSEGPQITLFVPSVYLRKGANTVSVVEMEGTSNCVKNKCSMKTLDHAIFNWQNSTETGGDFNLRARNMFRRRH